MKQKIHAQWPNHVYDDTYVQELFDRMGRTYDLVNLVSSLGFCAFWRYQCVRNLSVQPGACVCDMMSGTGECWSYLLRLGARSITSVDFSRAMVERQARRRRKMGREIVVLKENATATTIPTSCMDGVVSAFGLKTLSSEGVASFAREVSRILRPGGRFSMIEISIPSRRVFAATYLWYIGAVIPMIGRVCLGDIECYRMLGVYTAAFGSCESLVELFRDVGLEVSVRDHFWGCATSLVGCKAA